MQPGTEVGPYRVLSRLGEGGMGEVWLAEHVALGRPAAVKVLHPAFSARPEIVTRFFNEARAATRIADPGIIQIFDFGQVSDGTAYIVMELLQGEPLDQRLRRLSRLPVESALRLMRQVATSLGAAHARGIIHRDLKPENIFIVRDPEVPGGERPKLLDFGIAKLADATTGVKTQTAALMGTPTYMSPEQCRGAGEVDQRADVYSLGCVLFQLVTGRVPFDADGVGEIIAMHLREPAPRVSSLVPDVPVEADALIARCLAKQPDERFASATELARALAALGGATGAHDVATPALPRSVRDVTGSPVVATPRQPMATTLSSAAMQVVAPLGGRRWWLGGVAAVALGAGVTFVIVRAAGSGGGAGGRAAAPSVAEPVAASAPPARPPQPAAPRATTSATSVAAARHDRTDPGAPPVDAATDTTRRISAVLAAFAGWARTHAGASCPGGAELGVSLVDGWDHAMRITCKDQPIDRQVGVVSAGPDGVFGSADDLASWRLGGELAARVRGPRWGTPRVLRAKPAAAPRQPPRSKIDCFTHRC